MVEREELLLLDWVRNVASVPNENNKWTVRLPLKLSHYLNTWLATQDKYSSVESFFYKYSAHFQQVGLGMHSVVNPPEPDSFAVPSIASENEGASSANVTIDTANSIPETLSDNDLYALQSIVEFLKKKVSIEMRGGIGSCISQTPEVARNIRTKHGSFGAFIDLFPNIILQRNGRYSLHPAYKNNLPRPEWFKKILPPVSPPTPNNQPRATASDRFVVRIIQEFEKKNLNTLPLGTTGGGIQDIIHELKDRYGSLRGFLATRPDAFFVDDDAASVSLVGGFRLHRTVSRSGRAGFILANQNDIVRAETRHLYRKLPVIDRRVLDVLYECLLSVRVDRGVILSVLSSHMLLSKPELSRYVKKNYKNFGGFIRSYPALFNVESQNTSLYIDFPISILRAVGVKKIYVSNTTRVLAPAELVIVRFVVDYLKRMKGRFVSIAELEVNAFNKDREMFLRASLGISRLPSLLHQLDLFEYKCAAESMVESVALKDGYGETLEGLEQFALHVGVNGIVR